MGHTVVLALVFLNLSDFHNGYTGFHSHQQWGRDSLSQLSHQNSLSWWDSKLRMPLHVSLIFSAFLPCLHGENGGPVETAGGWPTTDRAGTNTAKQDGWLLTALYFTAMASPHQHYKMFPSCIWYHPTSQKPQRREQTPIPENSDLFLVPPSVPHFSSGTVFPPLQLSWVHTP